mgnify:CR=1 FL=1
MNIEKQITEINDIKKDLTKEYQEKSIAHEKFLRDIISYYYVNITKNQLIGTYNDKITVSGTTSEILEYTDHLYNLNIDNLKLIQDLYKKLHQNNVIM